MEGHMKGFRDFILRGNVIDLAVAVVIGVAFSNIVSALVKDLITPLIAAIGGQPDFSSISFTINNSKILIGDFFNSLITFLIFACLVYYLLLLTLKALMIRLIPPQKPTPETTPHC